MSWYLNYKKYKKLVKELVFHRSELEFQKEVLREYHLKFEEKQREYCAKNEIDLAELQKQHTEKLKELFPSSPKKPENEEGIIPVDDKSKEQKKRAKEFLKVYKLIAKKIHPDKFANRFRTEEIAEKEELFKEATEANEKADYGRLLEIAEELKIKPVNLKNLCSEIKTETESIKHKIKHNEKMFSWRLYVCEEDEVCEDSVIKDFLRQLFNYTEKKI